MRDSLEKEEEVLKWNPSSQDCPPPNELAILSIQSPEQWPEHVRICPQCKEALQTLQDKDPAKHKLDAFLARVEADARNAEEAVSQSIFSSLRAFFMMRDIRWSTAALALALFLLAGVWFWGQYKAVPHKNEMVTLTFDPDQSAKEIKLLEELYEKLSQGEEVPKAELVASVEDFKQRSMALHQRNLDEWQRGELASLTARWNAAVELRSYDWQNAPRQIINPDTQKAEDLFASIAASYDAFVGFSGEHNLPPERSRAREVERGAAQVALLSLGDRRGVLRDNNPERSEKDKVAICLGVRNVSIKYGTVFEFKGGTNTRMITASWTP
jgi:hypothetical protein